MRHHQHGAPFGGQLFDGPFHLIHQFRIQCRSGLVKQQQLGVHGNSTGDAHTLLLPT